MSYVLLRGTRRGTRGGGRHAGVVETRFLLWNSGDRQALLRLWHADRLRAGAQQQRRGRSSPLDEVLELIRDGEMSRAMRLLHSMGIADVTNSTLAQLRDKHPPRDRPVPANLP